MDRLRKCTDDIERSIGAYNLEKPDENWTLGMHLNGTGYMTKQNVIALVKEYEDYAKEQSNHS